LPRYKYFTEEKRGNWTHRLGSPAAVLQSLSLIRPTRVTVVSGELEMRVSIKVEKRKRKAPKGIAAAGKTKEMRRSSAESIFSALFSIPVFSSNGERKC
jgi:hypothetical protein